MKSIITVVALTLLTLIALCTTTMVGLFINMTNLEFIGLTIIICGLASIVVFSKLEVENV